MDIRLNPRNLFMLAAAVAVAAASALALNNVRLAFAPNMLSDVHYTPKPDVTGTLNLKPTVIQAGARQITVRQHPWEDFESTSQYVFEIDNHRVGSMLVACSTAETEIGFGPKESTMQRYYVRPNGIIIALDTDGTGSPGPLSVRAQSSIQAATLCRNGVPADKEDERFKTAVNEIFNPDTTAPLRYNARVLRSLPPRAHIVR